MSLGVTVVWAWSATQPQVASQILRLASGSLSVSWQLSMHWPRKWVRCAWVQSADAGTLSVRSRADAIDRRSIGSLLQVGGEVEQAVATLAARRDALAQHQAVALEA